MLVPQADVYIPLAASGVSPYIDVGMDFTTSPPARVSILVLSSAVDHLVADEVRLRCPLDIPSPSAVGADRRISGRTWLRNALSQRRRGYSASEQPSMGGWW